MATLSHTGVRKVEELLQKSWKSGVCPFSGHQDWTIVDELVDIKPYRSQSKIGDLIGDPGVVKRTSPWFGPPASNRGYENTYPAVMVVCKGCGYMALFSAVVLGLTEMTGDVTSG